MTKASDDGIRGALARGLSILETLASSGEPFTLTALSDALDIPLATCSSIMVTLEERGYATRRVNGRSHFWYPTLRLYTVGSQLVRGLNLLEVAQPVLRTLADRSKTSAHIGRLDGPNVVYVAKANTTSFVQFNTYPGKVSPFEVTALGRAIAAYLPELVLRDMFAQLAPSSNSRARAAHLAKLSHLLEEIRQRGYAVEEEEEEEGIACIAAPIFRDGGTVSASIGVTGFADDLIQRRFRQIAQMVTQAAREISVMLGHQTVMSE